ncbi:transposase [Bradyrhizobium icense]|uniref:transposase n=1 Tax=Bradyrhizobium icense TaxID=1274631 RepID=UPI0009F3DC31
MEQFVLTDANERTWNRCVSANRAIPDAAARTTGHWSRRCYGSRGPGRPWRDLPRAFGHWSAVYTRFRDWVKAYVWKRLFDSVSDEPDVEYATVDATIVKVHCHLASSCPIVQGVIVVSVVM